MAPRSAFTNITANPPAPDPAICDPDSRAKSALWTVLGQNQTFWAISIKTRPSHTATKIRSPSLQHRPACPARARGRMLRRSTPIDRNRLAHTALHRHARSQPTLVRCTSGRPPDSGSGRCRFEPCRASFVYKRLHFLLVCTGERNSDAIVLRRCARVPMHLCKPYETTVWLTLYF